MAWEDRPYYRDHERSSGRAILNFLNGSAPLGTWFGIRVRMHSSLILVLALQLLLAGRIGFVNAAISSVGLFLIVLLHEFGHCFAARAMNGEANEILLWPLGGLATVDAPNRPWPQFVTAVGGPLVNVAICLVTWGAIFAATHSPWLVSLNPFRAILPNFSVALLCLWWVFMISWGLLLFNLLPIFPLDGGRILQAGLWWWLGFYRGTIIACMVGMIGAGLMVLCSLPSILSWQGGILFFIGVNCFFECFMRRAAMKAAGPWEFQSEDEEIDYSASLFNRESKRGKRVSRWAERRAQKRAQQDRIEQIRIDRILAKVSAGGMGSLSWWERRTLRRATAHQRKREMAHRR